MSIFSFGNLLPCLVLVAVAIFIWKFLVADLPDDFVSKLSERSSPVKEQRDGGLRDNG
jgi:hypothetical protein